MGCENEGAFPAPKEAENLSKKDNYCLKHIREFNQNWDFFKHKNQKEIQDFQYQSLLGHRETKPFGVKNIDINSLKELQKNIKNIFIKKPKEIKYTKKEIEALNMLDLNVEAKAEDIKKRYKILVKKFHPDINGKKSEEKFKKINNAYNLLIKNQMDV